MSDYINSNTGAPAKVLSRSLIFIMAAASGLTIANIYYVQPLLQQMADYYQITESYAGLIATSTQVGLALGLFFILPLADTVEKRGLILTMIVLETFFLLLLYFSGSLYIAMIASLGIGFCSTVPQLLIPLGAQLSHPSQRGEVIGSIMSGLLTGILLSRVISGFVGEYTSWKNIYLLSAIVMLLLLIVLRLKLPKTPAVSKLTYAESMKSLPALLHKFPVVIKTSFIGAMVFFAFSAFWTALTFFLESPAYKMGADVAGLFGLVGVVGAALSPVAGKISDKKGPRFTAGICIVILLVSYIVFAAFGFALWGLILGVILLDLGVNSCNVSNQTQIHQLSETARNRLTSIYMVSFFVGGALGSELAAISYEHFGWLGVCCIGFISQVMAMAVHMTNKDRQSKEIKKPCLEH